jgi:hypothetical protein
VEKETPSRQLPELICDVCKEEAALGVASSVFGAFSMAYCKRCLDNHADAEWCFAFCAEMNGNEVAPWVRKMNTYKEGRYVSWDEWISSPAGQEAIADGERNLAALSDEDAADHLEGHVRRGPELEDG